MIPSIMAFHYGMNEESLNSPSSEDCPRWTVGNVMYPVNIHNSHVRSDKDTAEEGSSGLRIEPDKVLIPAIGT